MQREIKDAEDLKAGDIIITTFWDVPEVCKVYSTKWSPLKSSMTIIRLESIVHQRDAKKEYCAATIESETLKKFPFTFLHESKWYLMTDEKHKPEFIQRSY